MSSEERLVRASNLPKDIRIQLVKYVAVLRSPTERNEMPSRGFLQDTMNNRFGRILDIQPFTAGRRTGMFITFASGRTRDEFTSHLRSAPRSDRLHRLRDTNRTMEMHVLMEYYLVPDKLLTIVNALMSETSSVSRSDDRRGAVAPRGPSSQKERALAKFETGLEKPPSPHLRAEDDRDSKPRDPPSSPNRTSLVHRISIPTATYRRIKGARGTRSPSPLASNPRHRPIVTKSRFVGTLTLPSRASAETRSPSLLSRISPPSPQVSHATATRPPETVAMPHPEPKTATEPDQSRGVETSEMPTSPSKDVLPQSLSDSAQQQPSPSSSPSTLISSMKSSVDDTNPHPKLSSRPCSLANNICSTEQISLPLQPTSDITDTALPRDAEQTSATPMPGSMAPQPETCAQAQMVDGGAEGQLCKAQERSKGSQIEFGGTQERKEGSRLEDERQSQVISVLSQAKEVGLNEVEETSGMVLNPSEIGQMRKKNAVLEGEVVLLKRLIAEKEGSFKKELGELGSAKALLCEELEKQKTLLSEMGKVMRELKSRQEGCEEEMKKLRLEHQRDIRVLKEEVVQRDARVLVEKFPTASKSLIQAFVMTANLGKRRRNGLEEDEGCHGDYLYLLLLFG